MRNHWPLRVAGLIAVMVLAVCPGAAQAQADDADPVAAGASFRIEEATIDQVHQALRSQRISCRGLVHAYLRRMDALQRPIAGARPLDAIRMVNPRALDRARALDRLDPVSRHLRPLFCVPVLVKDNYDVRGLPTTAGSRALLRSYPARDAFVIRRLEAAGAVVLAKTNMAELALYGSSINSLTGDVGSAYDSSRDAGGSSSGSAAAVSANAGLTAIGTDTCGSNRVPAANNGIVGFRGSLGLVSRTGIVPMSTLRDAPGPMARTVTDLARMLDVMATVDPHDSTTVGPARRQPASYAKALAGSDLRGKRIGVLRELGSGSTVGDDLDVVAAVARVIAELRAAGAVVVDGLTLPQFEELNTTPFEAPPLLDEYLRSIPHPRVADFDALAASDQTLPSTKELLNAVAQIPPDSPEYQRMAAARSVMRGQATTLLRSKDLDALVYPTTKMPPPARGADTQTNSCELAASTGMPSVVVPAGYTRDDPALPVSIEFFGRIWDETTLLQIAHAYEQHTHHRRAPA